MLFAVVVIALAAVAFAQKKPNPPEDFHSKVGAYFHRKNVRDIGEGYVRLRDRTSDDRGRKKKKIAD